MQLSRNTLLWAVTAAWLGTASWLSAAVTDGALLSEPTSEDDFPAVTAHSNGELAVAWVSHDPEGQADSILVRTRRQRAWSPAERLDIPHKDIYVVQSAYTPDGSLWLVWSAQVDGNWDLYAVRRANGRWSPARRLTSHPMPDVHHRLVVDSGGALWVCWQGFRGGSFDILLQRIAPTPGREVVVTADPANHWFPDIAAGADGRLWVAWDSYRTGNYDVYLARVESERVAQTIQVTGSGDYQANVRLACDDQERVWLAWDNGGPDWGKDMPGDGGWKSGAWRKETEGKPKPKPEWDTAPINRMGGLHRCGRIETAVYANGRLQAPAQPFNTSLEDQYRDACELPAVAIDGDGRVWVFSRFNPKRVTTGKLARRVRLWTLCARYYDGRQWSPTIDIANSEGREDHRSSIAGGSDGSLWIAYPEDGRMTKRGKNHNVRVVRVSAAGPAQPVSLSNRPPQPEAPPAMPKVRYAANVGGKQLQLCFGDLHRHTEFSGDGAWDGSLMEMYRYAMDAAALDFITTTDHNYGSSEYYWWLTQKWTDVFHAPGTFTPLYAYERSLPWPNGHRNVINLKRGRQTTPVQGKKKGRVPKDEVLTLWQRIRGQEVITIPHTIAAGGGNDWEFNDPKLEPLMEIYQGCRNAYEYAGAPKSPRNSKKESFKYAAGFAWNALAKGYRIGFIAASDHRSTHLSYACVYAAERSREAIFRAMQQRHAYAATDNIILDVQCAGKMMGDEVTLDSEPVFHVRARGTAPLKQVDVIRNQKFVYTAEPGAIDTEFDFRDRDLKPGQSTWYYVRVQQQDEQIAWGSPIWVTRRED